MQTQKNKKTATASVVAEIASRYVALHEEAKKIEEQMKNAKAILVEHAQQHRDELTDEFRVYITDEVYASLRTTPNLIGTKPQKEQLIAKVDDAYIDTSIAVKELYVAIGIDEKLRKIVTSCGCRIEDKETWAIHVS